MQRAIAVTVFAALLAALALMAPASASPSAEPSAPPTAEATPGLLTSITQGVREAAWDAAVWLWDLDQRPEPRVHPAILEAYGYDWPPGPSASP